MDKSIFCLALLLYFSLPEVQNSESENDAIIIEHGSAMIDIICLVFNISTEDCTCEKLMHLNFTLGDTPVSETCAELERIDKERTTKQTRLAYVAKVSRSYAAVTVAAWIASVIGNGLVVLVSWSKRRNLSNFTRIIAFLALCDIIFSCLECLRVFPTFWTNRFVLGTFMCKFLNGGTALGANIAVGLIVIISVDRYFGIVYPLKTGLTKLMVNILLIANVIVAVAAVVPLYVYYGIDSKIKTCRLVWPNDIGRKDSRIYHWFQLAVYTLLPCIVIAVLYTMIVISLSQVVAKGHVVFHNSDLRKQRMRDNRRVALILFAVVLAFMLLVAPHRFVLLYFDLVGASEEDPWLRGINGDLYFGLYATILLYPLHVAVNPIIYCAIDAKWREDVRRVLRLRSFEKGLISKARSKTLSTTISNASTYSPSRSERRKKSNLTVEMARLPKTSDSSLNSVFCGSLAVDHGDTKTNFFSSRPSRLNDTQI